MRTTRIGFVGGGRVVRILLTGLARSAASRDVVVSDPDSDAIEALVHRFPAVRPTEALAEVAGQDVVFCAVPPPLVEGLLPEIGPHLGSETVFVSLAPVVRLPVLQDGLGVERVARMIPNAASIIGSGFNPVAFSEAWDSDDKKALLEWLSVLGECPEVPDEQVEAFAVLTAMGPTYFWYQLDELQQIGERLGLDEAVVRHALSQMLHGATTAFFEADLPVAELVDLIPAKPMQEHEATIRAAYDRRLGAVYEQLTHR